MEFFLFIGALILCKVVYDKLQGRIETLTKELAALRMDVLNLKNGTSNSMLKAESSVALSAMEPKTTATMLKPSPAKTSTPPKPVLPRKSWRDSQLWKDLESQFAGNVTGVVGTLAVVLGIIFLGVYSAIQLDPIGRFGIVILFSLGLYAGYFFLSRKSFWKNISLWIRSAAGVTFLMGCLGSVGIDSMKWVSDPLIALGLLSLGLSANLVLGFLNGGEVFAAVHVIFSLFALALIPVNQVVFGIAALVAVVGILMSSKERHWDRNIMATVIGFSLLHFYWFFSNGAENFSVGSLPAIVMCLMVGMVALANHYRQTYQKINLGAEPLLAHILTWVTLGLNLLLHAHGSVWSSLLLALSSIVAFAISDRARKMQIHWLYVCDRIVSLLLSLFAVASLHKLGLSVFEISAIAVIVAAVFLRIAVSSFDEAIFNISNKVLLFGYAVLAICFFSNLRDSREAHLSSMAMIVCSFVILACVFPAIQKVAREKKLGFSFVFDKKSYPATALEIPLAFHGFLAFLLVIMSATKDLMILCPLALSLVTLFLRAKFKNLLFDLAALVGILLSAFMGWQLLLESSHIETFEVILTAGLFAWGFVGFKFSWVEEKRQAVTGPSICLIWITAMVTSYSFTKNISPILPGVCWLFLSMIAGELKDKKIISTKSSEASTITEMVGLLSLGLFLVRFFLVDISNEALAFNWIRLRLFSEILSGGVFFYWIYFASPSLDKKISDFVDHLIEILLAVFVIYILQECVTSIHPLIWAGMALGLYFVGKKNQALSRLMLYGYGFYFASLFHIAFLSTTLATPSNFIFDQAWVLGLAAVFVSSTFMVLAYRDRGQLQQANVQLPRVFKFAEKWKNSLLQNGLPTLLYPLFVAVGFFLFWSFDKTILSLMWVVECFGLFVISLFMREPQFRLVSMAGIGIVLVRIVFYDLTGQDFFIKAMVFISVGVVLIAMNAIYNKYKYRYESN